MKVKLTQLRLSPVPLNGPVTATNFIFTNPYRRVHAEAGKLFVHVYGERVDLELEA